MSQMTNSQRAMQFWSVLVLAAKTQQVLSYETMQKLTGIPKFGMGRPLGKVLSICQKAGLPRLTVLVLDQSEGKPADTSFEALNLEAEIRRVFIFDWFKQDFPSLTEFEGADDKLESVIQI